MRRLVSYGVALAIAGTTAVLAPITTTSAAPAAAAKTSETQFAFNAVGYGTRLNGGEIPVGSDDTAYQGIGCTNIAGLEKFNTQAQQVVPGLGTLNGLRTRVWTKKRNGAVSSYARHTVAKVTLVDSPLGSLDINGVVSQARTWHDNKGFHAETITKVASITFTPAGMDPQVIDVPTPGQPAEIPGLATITIGDSIKKKDAHGARAVATAILIEVIPTDSRVKVARTGTRIEDGITSGVFRGFSAGLKARGLDNNTRVGRTPLSILPCQGTDGELRKKALASVDLEGAAVVGAVRSEQRASGTSTKAKAMERGEVGKISLGDGQVVISGVTGQANVERTKSGLKRSVSGTQVVRIKVDGEVMDFPRSGVIEVPGLVRIQDRIVKRSHNGIEVTALRLTLLDDTLAVIDLGMAKAEIRRGPSL